MGAWKNRGMEVKQRGYFENKLSEVTMYTNWLFERHLDLSSEGMEVIGRCSAVDHLRGGGGREGRRMDG